MGHEEGHDHDGEHHHHHEGDRHAHHHDEVHAHGDAQHAARAPLSEGEGVGKTLFFDAFSGIAGDMTIAALLDLGFPMRELEAALAHLPLRGYHLHRGVVRRSGIVATTFDVHVEGAHPERTYAAIDRMLRESSLPRAPLDLARRIFLRLAEAEANVHKMPLDAVHFHEVGGVDAIIDIVGSAVALSWLGAAVVASPLPMGRGFVRARHGILPLPAPAVVDCLRGVPTYAVDIDAELVTPTGAAIAATVAERFASWPAFAPLRVGWGAGQRELADRPNLLRVVLGDENAAARSARPAYAVLETNVDDMTGELAAHALALVREAGALDAWAVPITMKKGRPGLTLSVLCTAAMTEAMSALLLRETSSIGLRVTGVERVERPRRMLEVATRFGTIAVKISEGPYGAPRIKPEFDVCAAAARRAGVPVGEVIEAARAAAETSASQGETKAHD